MAIAVPFVLGGKVVNALISGAVKYGGKLAGMTPWGQQAKMGYKEFNKQQTGKAMAKAAQGKGFFGKALPKSVRDSLFEPGIEMAGPGYFEDIRKKTAGRPYDAQKAYKQAISTWQARGRKLDELPAEIWNDPNAIAALDDPSFYRLVTGRNDQAKDNVSQTAAQTQLAPLLAGGRYSSDPLNPTKGVSLGAGGFMLDDWNNINTQNYEQLTGNKAALGYVQKQAGKWSRVKVGKHDRNLYSDDVAFGNSGARYLKAEHIGPDTAAGLNNLFDDKDVKPELKHALVTRAFNGAGAGQDQFASQDTVRAIRDSANKHLGAEVVLSLQSKYASANKIPIGEVQKRWKAL